MKILLTGAGGMLGYAFCELLNDKEQLFAFDRNGLDLRDEKQIPAKLAEIKPDFVINCAAYTNVDGAETDIDDAYKINAHSLKALVEACNDIGSFLIHFSTDYVFDGEAEGFKEDDIKKPINVYGESKAAGEEVILANASKFAIFRTSWLFGPHGKNFVETMLNLTKDRNELNVVSDQTGSPTYTVDLAKAVYRFMQSPQIGIFHLSNEGVHSWYEYAKLIFKIAKVDVKVSPVSSSRFVRKAKRPKNSVLINTKLDKLPTVESALVHYLSKKA